jgi:hypothetical protein
MVICIDETPHLESAWESSARDDDVARKRRFPVGNKNIVDNNDYH